MTIHLALDEDHFRTLVSGGIVTDAAKVGEGGSITLVVKIILSDIGFAVMRKAIDDAEELKNGDRTR